MGFKVNVTTKEKLCQFAEIKVIRTKHHLSLFTTKATTTPHLEDGDSLIEMVVLQSGCCVDGSEWRTLILHPVVIFTTMIKVVAKTSNVQRNRLIEKMMHH